MLSRRSVEQDQFVSIVHGAYRGKSFERLIGVKELGEAHSRRGTTWERPGGGREEGGLGMINPGIFRALDLAWEVSRPDSWKSRFFHEKHFPGANSECSLKSRLLRSTFLWGISAMCAA